MSTQFPPYRSQLLRMWVEPAGRRSSVWRFSLEDVGTGQRAGFADLDGLICHLLALMESPTAAEQEGSLLSKSQATDKSRPEDTR